MLRKVFSWLLGFVGAGCILNGMLILGSNAVARLHPDGFPIDSPISPFVWGIVLAIAAVAIWPPEPRQNRYIDDYRSRLPVPLERVL